MPGPHSPALGPSSLGFALAGSLRPMPSPGSCVLGDLSGLIPKATSVFSKSHLLSGQGNGNSGQGISLTVSCTEKPQESFSSSQSRHLHLGAQSCLGPAGPQPGL